MPSTIATKSSDPLAASLREAIESERYEDALPLLAEYSACIAQIWASGGESPIIEQAMELMQWAHRTVAASRAHANDQFQLLSDSRVYSAPNPDRKTWQLML